jgi:cation:H+ antiporter
VLVGGYSLLHGFFGNGPLGVYEAGALLLLFVWFAAASVFEKKEPVTLVFDTRLEHLPKEVKKEVRVGRGEGANALAVFLLAIAVLLGASYFILESAIGLAGEFGVAGGFVGATIVSLGTTLPELSVALQAFRKKHYGIGLGNAIGSVIVNSTLVLGTAALFGLVLAPLSLFAVAVGFVVTALLVFMFMGGLGKRFGRWKGAVLLVVYLLYLAAITYVQLAG